MCGSTGLSRVQMAVVALVACACLEVCLAEARAEARAEAHSDLFSRDGHSRIRTSAGTYCGSRLSEALKFMCNGQYNSYFKTKKDPFEDRNSYRLGHTSEIVEEYWPPPVHLPFRERLRAAAFLESRTRIRRGVFDECCTKSCTIDELMSYCEKRD